MVENLFFTLLVVLYNMGAKPSIEWFFTRRLQIAFTMFAHVPERRFFHQQMVAKLS